MENARLIAVTGIAVSFVAGCLLFAAGLAIRGNRTVQAAPPALAAVPEPPAPPVEAPVDPLVARVLGDCATIEALDGDALAVALDDWSATATDTTYAMVQRGGHYGERVVYDGTIHEVMELSGGGTALLFQTAPFEGWYVVARNVEPHLVAGSRARLYGYIAGMMRGDGIEMPSIMGVAAVPRAFPRHASEAMRRRLAPALPSAPVVAVAPRPDRVAEPSPPEPEGQREAVIVPVAPEPGTRSAHIVVETYGVPARVLIDEIDVGRTPLSGDVDDGSHTIDMITDDGQTYSTTRTFTCCDTYRITHRFD